MPAPPDNSLAPGEAHLWYAWTERCCTPARLELYRSLLCADEARRLAQLRFEHLRHEFLLTRALCRLSLSTYADVQPSAWRFEANAFGRPRILAPTPSPSLRFNLANARSLVACIVTCDVDAGVDVEQTQRHDDIVDHAQHYFSASELHALRSLPHDRQRQRFFELWTLKESYIKARGMGLSIPLDRFSFDLEHAPSIRIAIDSSLGGTAQDWHFELFAPADGHLIAASVPRAPGSVVKLMVRETVPGSAIA